MASVYEDSVIWLDLENKDPSSEIHKALETRALWGLLFLLHVVGTQLVASINL